MTRGAKTVRRNWLLSETLDIPNVMKVTALLLSGRQTSQHYPRAICCQAAPVEVDFIE